MHRDDLLAGRIDVLALLRDLDEYILIKRDEFFPRYAPGSDIDLVVFDREESLRRVVHFYNNCVAPEGELSVTDTTGHCHADFRFDEVLDLRVDLIDDFDFFQNIAVKRAYLTKLFLDRQRVQCGEYEIYVPGAEDELTLRYFEYLEWFDRRPDKIKHLDYICQVEDEDLKQRFFVNTHRYIQFKPKVWQDAVLAIRNVAYEPQSRREAARTIVVSIRHLIIATLRKWTLLLHRLGS